MKVCLFLDCEASEAADRDVLLELGDVLLDQVFDRGLGLADPGLLEQHAFLVEVRQPALDDLLPGRLGAAFVAGLLEVPVGGLERLLAIEHAGPGQVPELLDDAWRDGCHLGYRSSSSRVRNSSSETLGRR